MTLTAEADMKLPITTFVITALFALGAPIATQAKTVKRTMSTKHYTVGHMRRGGRMPGAKTF